MADTKKKTGSKKKKPSKMLDTLTLKQETYCLKRAVENLTQRQAYIEAFGRGTKTDKSLDEMASKLEKLNKVQSRIAKLRENLTERAIWSKADMINDLRAISNECKVAPVEITVKGELSVKRIDSKARGVAVNAIKTASEMLGYKAADKVEAVATIEIIMKGGDDKYGK